MKQFRIAPLVAAVASGLILFTTTGAGAAPRAADRDATARPNATLPCWSTVKYDGVNVRSAPKLGSQYVLGTTNRGDVWNAYCAGPGGDTYTACGGTSPLWNEILWNGRHAYVAALCVETHQ
ncbi:hypothetical protein PO587_27630 [Streptomyces gilvifuscus]|uniref:SH3 domain-containing protein n=1 Tax=Streptomyces gilvifuscus TaxID=1550617 RepID=A0ABT5G0M2_9ACTN|nr:hypothetical protein [Streptomyces gilvifuscus]MDC2958217.1 hypothetical protein [Streptomyces gilvifuscus]